jgi:hypothetical protein
MTQAININCTTSAGPQRGMMMVVVVMVVVCKERRQGAESRLKAAGG